MGQSGGSCLINKCELNVNLSHASFYSTEAMLLNFVKIPWTVLKISFGIHQPIRWHAATYVSLWRLTWKTTVHGNESGVWILQSFRESYLETIDQSDGSCLIKYVCCDLRSNVKWFYVKESGVSIWQRRFMTLGLIFAKVLTNNGKYTICPLWPWKVGHMSPTSLSKGGC